MSMHKEFYQEAWDDLYNTRLGEGDTEEEAVEYADYYAMKHADEMLADYGDWIYEREKDRWLNDV